MEKREFIKKALDTTNAFFYNNGFQAEAADVNPLIWDSRLREFERQNLVVTPLAEQFDFRSPGSDMRVTIDDAPSAAGALTETVDQTISAFTSRYVTFTPTEQGAAYQLTRKEAVRAFFNVAERMVTKLGYSLALRKDQLAVSTLYSGAGTTLIANFKAVTTDIASTDTLNYAEILRMRTSLVTAYYASGQMDLLISPVQEQQLLNLGTINKANEFGTRTAISNGYIGSLFGFNIYVAHSITPTANVAKAIGLGRSGSGEKVFAYAIKRDAMIERQYFARGRYWEIVAHEEYDTKVLHPSGVVVMATRG